MSAWRPLLYLVAGSLFGFLFLAEFALGTFVVVDLAIVALAAAGGIGARRGSRPLELWPIFVAAALVPSLMVDMTVVGLPRCGTVSPEARCLAGTRDVVTPFAAQILGFLVACAGIVVWCVRGLSRTSAADN